MVDQQQHLEVFKLTSFTKTASEHRRIESFIRKNKTVACFPNTLYHSSLFSVEQVTNIIGTNCLSAHQWASGTEPRSSQIFTYIYIFSPCVGSFCILQWFRCFSISSIAARSFACSVCSNPDFFKHYLISCFASSVWRRLAPCPLPEAAIEQIWLGWHRHLYFGTSVRLWS